MGEYCTTYLGSDEIFHLHLFLSFFRSFVCPFVRSFVRSLVDSLCCVM